MSNFSAPAWDVDDTSDKLAKEFFLEGKKPKNKKNKTSISVKHLKSELKKSKKIRKNKQYSNITKNENDIFTNIKNTKQLEEVKNKLEDLLKTRNPNKGSSKIKLSEKCEKIKKSCKNINKLAVHKAKDKLPNKVGIEKTLNKIKKLKKDDLDALLSDEELVKIVKKVKPGLKKKLKSSLSDLQSVGSSLKKVGKESELLVENEERCEEPVNTKKEKRLKKKLKRLQNSKEKSNKICGLNVDSVKRILTNVDNFKPTTLTLREKLMKQLKASRFRYINEQIYTTESKDAQELFKNDPEAFLNYHEGYKLQVSKWPMNPVDRIIKSIKAMPKNLVIADFGCGEAKLAKSVPQKVHSFDLVAVDPIVTACDITHCPLKKESVDVVVFCLSLMGTNLRDYLYEANRVLKIGGILKIAEVESRFDNVKNFVEGLQRFGFKNTMQDFTHKLFYFLDFKKERNIKHKNKLPTISLHPCLYKKR